MATVRAQVLFPTVAPQETDVVMNTLYFNVAATTDSNLQAVTAGLKVFYDTLGSPYPAGVRTQEGIVTYYDMAQPKPRPPVAEHDLNLATAGSGISGPPEVALCISFHGVRVAGMSQARRRGRIYIGPIDAALIQGPSPAQTLIDSLKTAAQALLDLSNNNAWKWVIWSQAQADSPQSTFPAATFVTGGWVDNAWDTQRRRGIDPTVKTTFGVPPALRLPSNELPPE